MAQQLPFRKVLFFGFVVFSGIASWQGVAMAQAISVAPGETVTLTFKLVNVGDTALQKVYVQLSREATPDWIQPEGSPPQTVDVPSKDAVNGRPSAMLPLTFRVDGQAPVDTEVSLPLWIRDGQGDVWVKIVQLRVIPQPKPEASRLFQNYPNPFNPETWIPYQLEKTAHVTLQIFHLSGSLVRTLDLGWREAGFYLTREGAAHWDGTNEAGERVASGVYFYHLQANRFSAGRKLIVLK